MKTFLKGIIVGIGGVSPGLSGSVLLIIFGLYRKTLDALGGFFKDVKKNALFLLPLVTGMWEFIRDFTGEVPGASAKDCGNYLDMNLPMAKYLANKHLREVLYGITDDRLVYPV